MSKIALAIVQQPPVFLNLAESMNKAERLVGQAARQGAQIIVFPEAWLPGYPVWLDEAPGSALWRYRPRRGPLSHPLRQLPLHGRAGDRAIGRAFDRIVGGDREPTRVRSGRRRRAFMQPGALGPADEWPPAGPRHITSAR